MTTAETIAAIFKAGAEEITIVHPKKEVFMVQTKQFVVHADNNRSNIVHQVGDASVVRCLEDTLSFCDHANSK